MIQNKSLLIMFLIFFTTVQPSALVNVKKIIPSIEIDLKYATTDNFTHQIVYEFSTCYLLEHIVEVLQKVQLELAQTELGLKIFDGYRTMKAQRTFWQLCPDERYVSNPDKEMGRHTRGTAVDVTLINIKTKEELEMPTAFDDFTKKAAPNYQGASKNAIKNRSILQHVMYKYGFTNNKTEWWHFDYKDWQLYPPLNINPNNKDRIDLAFR